MRKQAEARQAEILGVLRSRTMPMTACQVLEKLQSGEPHIAPPTVYRALAALTDQGRAHHLESLKAFVPCRCEHDGASLLTGLADLIAATGFRAERHIVEIHGHCRACTA